MTKDKQKWRDHTLRQWHRRQNPPLKASRSSWTWLQSPFGVLPISHPFLLYCDKFEIYSPDFTTLSVVHKPHQSGFPDTVEGVKNTPVRFWPVLCSILLFVSSIIIYDPTRRIDFLSQRVSNRGWEYRLGTLHIVIGVQNLYSLTVSLVFRTVTFSGISVG